MFFIIYLYNIFNVAIADETIRLAVLEFTAVGPYDSTYMLQLSDETRGAALEVFPSSTSKISVLTRENIVDVLMREGKDASCMEATCAVGVGRNIGARFIVVGTLTKIENTHSLTLKVFDSQSNDLIAQQSIRESNQLHLLSATRTLAADLMETSLSKYDEGRLGIRKIGGQEESWTPPAFNMTILDINITEPIDATVFWKSTRVCSSLPCTVYVPQGTSQLKIVSPQCTTITKKLSLKNRHTENIQMECAYGFIDRGLVDPEIELIVDGKPLIQEIERVDVGQKTISVEHPCYEPTTIQTQLRSREKYRLKNLRRNLQPITREHQFAFKWDTGGAIEGTILVDGKRVGTTEQTVDIPICAQSVSIKVNEETTFNIPLKQLSETKLTGIFAKKGFINIQFDNNTTVMIDDKPIRKSNVIEVVGGFHTITMTNRCFEDYTMDVSVSSNEVINVVYKALIKTPKTSDVTFNIPDNWERYTTKSLILFVDGVKTPVPTEKSNRFTITKDMCSEHVFKINTSDGRSTYSTSIDFNQSSKTASIYLDSVDISNRRFHQPHVMLDLVNFNINSRDLFTRFGETQVTLFKYKPTIPSLHLTLIENYNADYFSILPIGVGYQYDLGWISMKPFTSVNWNRYDYFQSDPFVVDLERIDVGTHIYFNYNDYYSDWIDGWSDIYRRDPWDFGTPGKAGRLISLRGGASYFPNYQTFEYFVGGSVILTGAGWDSYAGDGLMDAYLDNTRVVGLTIVTGTLGILGILVLAGMSDRRVKKNIVQIGESKSGIPIYQFEYLDPNMEGVYIGAMAQDLLETHPYAVVRLPFMKYYRVLYSVIDVDFYRIE